jgi:MSHA biogenesis protein MshQ
MSAVLRRLRSFACTCALAVAALPALAQITFVGSGTTAVNDDDISLTAPGGLAVGDVMLVFVTQRNGGAIGYSITPAGWTSVLSNNSGSSIGVTVFRKVANAADVGATFAWRIDRSDRTAAGIAAFRGVDSTVPLEASGSQTNGASTTYTAPSVTTTSANTMLVAFFAAANGDGSVNTVSGMSPAFSTGTGNGTGGAVAGGSYATKAAAGASGTKASAGNVSAASIGALVALKPAGSVTLRAEYRFDECAPANGTSGALADSSGNGRHATPFGVTTPSPAGRINRALGLSATGTGDYARLDASALNGLADFSVSLWFRTGVSKSQQEILQALGTSGSNPDEVEIYLVNSSNVVVNVKDSGDFLYATTTTLTNNAWHHLAFARSGSTGCLYIDGALVACNSGYGSGALSIQSNAFLAGQEQDSAGGSFTSSQAFEGLIDELKLYAGALGAAAITTIHANENAGLNADGSARAADGCAGPNHYQLSLPSQSIACTTSTVTVTACADASSPCTSPSTTLAGQTVTLAASAGTLAATTLTLNAAGQASTTLSHPSAANGSSVTVTLSGEQTAASQPRRCCADGTSCAAANSCSTTFATAGFIVAASNGGAATTIPTQTAGTGSGSFVLRAVRTNTSTQACEAALAGTTTVQWALNCTNPASCSSGNRMSVTGSAGATAIAANPSSTAVSMTFDANGNAPFSFNYADVGLVSLSASKAAGGALLSALSGSSNAFVVKPAGFTVSGIRCTTYAAASCATGAIASPGNNPAAASAAGSAFIPAGQPFTATVTAVDSAGNATPNFGRETSPEGVLLGASLVAPAGGASGTLANATLAGGSFASGVATVNNLAYSEVGIVTLTPQVADANYLGAGNVSGIPTGNVGRFVPARLALSGAAITPRAGLACSPASSFGYLDENIRFAFTLTAQNSAGATTQNYAGSFAKLDPTSASAFNLAGRDGSTVFSAANGRLALGSASGSFAAGAAAVQLTAAALRSATPEGPYSVAFGIAPADGDGVALAAFDLSVTSPFSSNDRATLGTLALRYGRLWLGHAIGAADRTLALPAAVQYWNGAAFADNTLDSCTTVGTAAVSFGNLKQTLTTSDTAVTGPLVFTAGRGSLVLAAPGGGRSGTLDVALSLGSGATDASCLQPWTPGTGDAATSGANLAYLRGAWCSAGPDKDPSARATFGRERGNAALVYRRENF